MAPKQMTQAAIAKLVADEVAKALRNDRADRNAGVELCNLFEKTECTFAISKCAERDKVIFATATLQGRALSWWNSQVATLGQATAHGKSWADLKKLMLDEFCPDEEISHMEDELRNLEVKNHDIAAYTHRFNELAMLCPEIVSTEKKKIKQYISGLPSSVKGETMSRFGRLELLRQSYRVRNVLVSRQDWRKRQSCQGKRKVDEVDQGNTQARPWKKDNRNGNKNNNKNAGVRAITQAPTTNVNQAPLVSKCDRCGLFHVGNCPRICGSYHLVGHVTKDCRVKGKSIATGANTVPVRGPNVVTGTFLVNNRYFSVLFDSGSDKSFINSSLSHLIDIEPRRIPANYKVELADGRVVSTNTVLMGCSLKLTNQLFEVDLMPIELGSYDVIIGMDWLVTHNAIIVCGKKEVHIPLRNRTLVVKGDGHSSRLKVISCIKARKTGIDLPQSLPLGKLGLGDGV
nr:hypothetical protein [Tanacetum cinerariifolium]